MSPWQELFQSISMREPSSIMPGSLAFDDASSRHSVVPDQNSALSMDASAPVSSSAEEMRMVQEKVPQAIPVPASKTSKPSTEVLVIVQPSPKMQQHHPFNLQVQLVSPKQSGEHGDDINSQNDTEQSDGSHGGSNLSGRTLGGSVARSSSQRSLKSHHSGSESSVASMNARRTIALYNLDYHQIRPKLVLDAGTDQQVAKFGRRTVEMSGFAILQPREITLNLAGAGHATGTMEPESSNMDHAYDGGVDDDNASSRSRKGLMNKIKRIGVHLRPRSHSPHAVHGRSSQEPVEMTPSMSHQGDMSESGLFNCHSASTANIPHATPRTHRHNRVTTSYIWEIKQFLRQPFVPDPATQYEGVQTKDIQPNSAEAHAVHHATSRAILTRILENFGSLNNHAVISKVSQPAKISIWFEWVREWNGGLDNPSNLYDPAVHGSLVPISLSAMASMDGRMTPMDTPHLPQTDDAFLDGRSQDAQGFRMRRPSLRRRGTSPSPPRHMVPGAEHENPDLRAWTCSIVLDGTIRIPIGRLVPAPQHPLVVCELLLPSPLPDLRYSALGADGGGFSREELRDIVSVTAMHLVIRESMVIHANVGYQK